MTHTSRVPDRYTRFELAPPRTDRCGVTTRQILAHCGYRARLIVGTVTDAQAGVLIGQLFDLHQQKET